MQRTSVGGEENAADACEEQDFAAPDQLRRRRALTVVASTDGTGVLCSYERNSTRSHRGSHPCPVGPFDGTEAARAIPRTGDRWAAQLGQLARGCLTSAQPDAHMSTEERQSSILANVVEASASSRMAAAATAAYRARIADVG
jgi:hypothetical protein